MLFQSTNLNPLQIPRLWLVLTLEWVPLKKEGHHRGRVGRSRLTNMPTVRMNSLTSCASLILMIDGLILCNNSTMTYGHFGI